jgi:hypothetical protein
MRNKLDKVEEVVKLLKAQPTEKTAGIRVEITLSGMDSFKELRDTLNEDYFVDLFAGNDPIIGVYSVPVQPQLAYALTILRRFRLLLRGDQNKAIPRNIHEKLTDFYNAIGMCKWYAILHEQFTVYFSGLDNASTRHNQFPSKV